MALRINVFLLLLFISLLLIPLSSGINVEGFKDGMMDPIHLLHKDDIQVKNSRKLIWMLDAKMQDYDDPGANPKHDPRRKPGNGRTHD